MPNDHDVSSGDVIGADDGYFVVVGVSGPKLSLKDVEEAHGPDDFGLVGAQVGRLLLEVGVLPEEGGNVPGRLLQSHTVHQHHHILLEFEHC